MNALMVFGIVLVGATAWLLARVVVLPRLHFEGHLRHVESYGFDRRVDEDDVTVMSDSRGWLNDRVNGLAEWVGRALMTGLPVLPAVRQIELSAAGQYDLTPESVHGYRALFALFAGTIAVLYGLASGGFSFFGVVVTVLLLVVAWAAPAILIRSRGRARLNRIDRELPQFLDLVVATVEAGISFGGSLANTVNRFDGPLGDELRITLQQQSLGISTERSLVDMADRLDTASIRAFARAVVRAESHGIAVGPVLRHLAQEVRQRRRDQAREKVQKAPIKMLFPLVVFILLPLLVVIMYPALYNILHTLQHT
jgi:hypothetical protein